MAKRRRRTNGAQSGPHARAFRRCDYCGASVKSENWLSHLRRVHLAELTPEDKVEIYSQRTIRPLVDETLDALRNRAEDDLNVFEQSVVHVDTYGTQDQRALMDWYFKSRSALDERVYNKEGLIEENAHYKLADLILATLEAVGLAKLTGKNDPVLRNVLESYVADAIADGDVKTGMEQAEFHTFMEERVIMTRLKQVINGSTMVELFDRVDRFLADALIYPGAEREEYIKTLHANPNHFRARFNLVGLLIEDGELEDAETQLGECLKLRPHAYDAAKVLADLLVDQGRAEEAIAVCESALAPPEQEDGDGEDGEGPSGGGATTTAEPEPEEPEDPETLQQRAELEALLKGLVKSNRKGEG